MAYNDSNLYYLNIRDDLLALLKSNVGTLNIDLTTAISDTGAQIIKGNPSMVPQDVLSYPYIMVDIQGKTEDFFAINGGNKRAVVTYSIYGLVSNASIEGYSDNDESYYLTRNIESVLRQHIAFSAHIDWSNITETSFDISSMATGVYVAGTTITLECHTYIY